MNVQNKNYADEIQHVFEQSNFVKDVGITYKDCGPGWCQSVLKINERHHQHSNIVHAGVIATMLDNTAGAAAFSLLPPGVNPVTLEFKVNLLRPAAGISLECKAQVLKPGSRFTVVESELFCFNGSDAILVAKATVTIVGLS